MENQSKAQSRFQIYMASIKRHHYLPFISPVQLLVVALILFVMYSLITFPNATNSIDNTISLIFLMVFYVLMMVTDILFYPLAINLVVNHPVFYQLAIPKSYAEAQRKAQEAYDNTEKGWRITYYGGREFYRTYDDEKAKFNAQMALGDHFLGILARGVFRIFLCLLSCFIGTAMFFLCKKSNLEF